MAGVIAEFFNILGVGVTPPTTVAELVPYLLMVYVGCFLVGQTFNLIGKVLTMLFDLLKGAMRS